jgi:predicted nucleic-acid-binding protein
VIALDTNLLIRLVIRDEPEKADLVATLMRDNETWLAKTVMLEMEWVLRYTYARDRNTIAEIFRRLLGAKQVHFEDRVTVIRALEHFERGMDFADALHLASSSSARRFETFDRALSRHAARLATRPPVEILGSKSSS